MYRPWTPPEEAALSALADLGAPLLATIFGRTTYSIRCKASERGVSVKKTSQINDTEMTQAALDHIKRVNEGVLCPHCSKRLVAIATTGLCGVCHKNTLIEAHNERLAGLEAQREINRLKKAQQRIRDELGIVPKRSSRKTRKTGGAAGAVTPAAPEQGGRGKASAAKDAQEVTRHHE